MQLLPRLNPSAATSSLFRSAFSSTIQKNGQFARTTTTTISRKQQCAARVSSSCLSAGGSTTNNGSRNEQQQQQKHHLILIGGGHAHVQVIKALNAATRPSHLQITLIDAAKSATYSGMVPGAVAGFYDSLEETQIHLEPLAEYSGIHFVHDRVVDIDFEQKIVYTLKNHQHQHQFNEQSNSDNRNVDNSDHQQQQQQRHGLPFDAISIDIGSTSRDLETVPGAYQYTIPTRPIDKLVQRLERAVQEAAAAAAAEDDNTTTTTTMKEEEKKTSYDDDRHSLSEGSTNATPRPRRLLVVGGGAAGMELTMALQSRWNQEVIKNRSRTSSTSLPLQCTLIHAGSTLMPDESESARQKLYEILNQKEIDVIHNAKVLEVTENTVVLEQQKQQKTRQSSTTNVFDVPFDYCIWATGAGAHGLARHLHTARGLDATEYGWIKVNACLQSTSHPFVFAAGDCAAVQSSSSKQESKMGLPKAGVYAVRSGPILIENLTRYLDFLMRQKQEQQQHEEQRLMKQEDNNQQQQQQQQQQLEKQQKDTDCEGPNLIRYEPQDDFLKLLVCGDGKALGLRFGLALYGRWVFQLKDHIDQQFMRLFDVSTFPPLTTRLDKKAEDDDDDVINEPQQQDGGESKRKYDTSQYDAMDDNEIPALEPSAAAALLQRTDDEVDYILAWKTLRKMAQDINYRQQVLSTSPATTTSAASTATSSEETLPRQQLQQM